MLDYTYRAYIPLLRELIVPMTLNASGVRDIARVLKISTNTVLEHLRRAARKVPEPCVPPRIAEMEMDEQWSFVQNKKQQHWLGLNRRTKRIAVFVLGRRTDACCRELCQKLISCHIKSVSTGDWPSYAKCLPAQKHRVGKEGTQNIERHNLNFRTHLKRLQRRTICFSKSKEMHYAVIKLYIQHINAQQHHF